MKSLSIRELLLAGTIISGLATAAPAFAQSQPAETEEDVVVVVGSRIASPNLVTTSPVTAVGAVELRETGATRIEDVVNELPQIIAAQNSTVSNGASGTAQVDLRGIGASRTLVLVDGRRLGYGSPNSTPADLNQVPGALVERVEVLTGGASAVYGSDAIAGVVNFVMRKQQTGLDIDVSYGFYSHSNDYDGPGNLRTVLAGRQATNPREYRLPKDDVITGRFTDITISLGLEAPDGRGNAIFYAGYRNNGEVLQADYDYSACSLGVPGATATSFSCAGSGTSAGGQFTDFASFFLTAGTATEFRNYSGATDAFNFGPLNYFQRPDERYVMGAFGNYEFNEHAEVYTQLMFSDYSTVAQIAPSGAFFLPVSVACNNPLLSATQRGQFGCTADEIASGAAKNLFVGRRNVEGGNRQDSLGLQSFRMVGGLRGMIVEGWDYDIALQYQQVTMDRVYLNELSNERSARALDVIPDPVTGQAVCRSVVNGVDPSCVPWNIWVPGGVTAAALNYVSARGLQNGTTTQQVVTMSATGDLGTYGVVSPFAETGVMVAVGAEYRRDGLDTVTDQAFTVNDLAGQGGPTIGLSGTTEVTEFFGEAKIPLIENMPFAQSVTLELAYRYSKYGSGVQTDTYNIGGDWAPTEDIRFRASSSRAVRAANVIELFQAQGLGLFDADTDPCATPAAVAPGELRNRCLATGVPVANLGNAAVLVSPAGQYNEFGGGNPNLNPEVADTLTVGIVFTPSFLPGFNLTVDYYDIEVEGLISTFGALNTLRACYNNGDAAACSRVQRNALGNLWTAGGQVINQNINIGSRKTTGYDVAANYRLDLADVGFDNLGMLRFSYLGSIMDLFEENPGPGLASFECQGIFAGSCLRVRPEYRHRVRMTWDTPWDVTVGATWRYISEVTLPPGSSTTRIDYRFKAENYLDLNGTWDVRDNVSLRFGVNNVLDNDPPLSGSVGTTGNGNTYPQTYDAMGREVFVGLNVKF